MYILKKNLILLSIVFCLLMWVSKTVVAADIMDVMFEPAKSYEKIIDLGSTKTAVGNEVFKESIQLGVDVNFSYVCSIKGQSIPSKTIDNQKTTAGYNWSNQDFCEKVLWGSYNKNYISWTSQQQAPLIVRITKFLLRLTVVLAITMILYNGIMWIIESSKGGDVKDAKNNIIYVVGGILVALSSVALINLISSLSINSLNPSNMPQAVQDAVVQTGK